MTDKVLIFGSWKVRSVSRLLGAMMKRLTLISLFCLLCSFTCLATSVAASLGKVSGQLKVSAVETCRGIVSLWPNDGKSASDPYGFNVIPRAVAELADDCSFVIEAAPGNYFLSAVVRNSPGPSWGPPRKGDLIFMAPDGEGEMLSVVLRPEMPVDVGIHRSYWQFSGFSGQIETGITGRLINQSGTPVAGLRVQVFDKLDMTSQLLAVSAPSDDEGRFELRLVEPGLVYLHAREEVGIGLPPLGSYFGRYGGNKVKRIKVKKGKLIEGLEIVVQRRTMEKTEGEEN